MAVAGVGGGGATLGRHSVPSNCGDLLAGNPVPIITIVDDLPKLTIADTVAYEGDNVVFTVKLAQALDHSVSVGYSTPTGLP